MGVLNSDFGGLRMHKIMLIPEDPTQPAYTLLTVMSGVGKVWVKGRSLSDLLQEARMLYDKIKLKESK